MKVELPIVRDETGYAGDKGSIQMRVDAEHLWIRLPGRLCHHQDGFEIALRREDAVKAMRILCDDRRLVIHD